MKFISYNGAVVIYQYFNMKFIWNQLYQVIKLVSFLIDDLVYIHIVVFFVSNKYEAGIGTSNRNMCINSSYPCWISIDRSKLLSVRFAVNEPKVLLWINVFIHLVKGRELLVKKLRTSCSLFLSLSFSPSFLLWNLYWPGE